MSYLDFLAEWYNLVFLAAGALALVVAAGNRLRGRSSLALPAGLLVAAVTGLTWNGAIHDLGGGSPAPRFPLVVVVAAAVGVLGGRTLALVRDRFFRPITAVCFNRPGYEGVEARVAVTRAWRLAWCRETPVRSPDPDARNGRTRTAFSISSTYTRRARRSGSGDTYVSARSMRGPNPTWPSRCRVEP
jgi:hypothetical protein